MEIRQLDPAAYAGKNIRAKCLRSNNPQNVVKATMQGLTSLRDAAEVARIRGKNVEDIVG